MAERPGRGLKRLTIPEMTLKEGTIVDATIIQAPSSTKNREGKRDPEMHQVKKGNQYHFEMKLHIGVDAETGLVHSMETTPANVHDVTQAGKSAARRVRRQVWGDAGYTGVGKRAKNQGLAVEWLVALKPGKRRLLERGGPEEWFEKTKASVRAKSLPPTRSGVEHPFLDVKRDSSAMPRYATGAWPRTRNEWPCCWGWPT